MAKPVKVGVVGFGYWGPNLVRNLDRAERREHRRRLRPVAGQPGQAHGRSTRTWQTTSDMGAFLSRLRPRRGRRSPRPRRATTLLAKKALEAGKHVYVEKPLTLTSADAEELVRSPTSAGVVLMVGHLMEYHSAINWIRDYIASGELGDVLYLYAQRLNLGKVRTEENAFWSLAPHDVSIVLYLLGETPDSVSRQRRRVPQRRRRRTRSSPTCTSRAARWPTST